MNLNILVYEPSKLKRTVINAFPGAKTEEFKLPKLIWKFLDEIYPGNSKTVLKLLHDITEKDAPEMVIGLINWRLTDIIIFLEEPEKITYEAWRVSKLSSQAKKFTKSKVKELLRELARADFRAKTGAGDLLTSLDLLIAGKLE